MSNALIQLLALENSEKYHKRGMHWSFTRLAIDLIKVDPIRRASKVLGVDGHKSAHELVRIHGSEKEAFHVFAQCVLASGVAVMLY